MIPDNGELAGLLAGWMPRQRWYAAKGRELTGVRLERLAELAGPVPVLMAVAEVDAGETYRYSVPLSARPEPEPALEHALVGQTSGVWLYDAPHDQAATGVLLELLAASAQVSGLGFHSAEPLAGGPGVVVGAEQSNTSIVYGDALILKLFRRLSAGLNPDLELTRALHAAGTGLVARPLGWISGQVAGEDTTLGILQPFFRSATEGWKLATASVRDLFAEADLHADEVGGDFAGEAHRLGAATGEVHRLLAEVLPTARAGAAQLAALGRSMAERLDAAVAIVPELAPHTGPLREAFGALGAPGAPVTVQRIHGDYHLGQVLRTDSGWVLLDFEGEPAKPLPERRELASPLRDVAGMLRSFDYAARSLLAEQAERGSLAYRAAEWAERNREAFCDGYTETGGADPREQAVLLRALELDKAVYEVVYEARHRPSWLPIPLGSIERLAH